MNIRRFECTMPIVKRAPGEELPSGLDPGDAKHLRTRRRIARELGVPLDTLTEEQILSVRCWKGDRSLPKVMHETLAAAKDKAVESTAQYWYPCPRCLCWHLTSTISLPRPTFNCECCGLEYVERGSKSRFCSKGCRRRFNRAKHKAEFPLRKPP